MKLPGNAPTPWKTQTSPTSAAIAATTKRVRSLRGEWRPATVVACTGEPPDAADRRR